MGWKIADFVQKFETRVPLHLAMEGDRNGLKIGSMQKELTKILCTLELTQEIIEQAAVDGVDMIVVHHDPLYFAPSYLRYDDPHTQLTIQLITHDIALYVAHTNLDIVEGGLNDYLFHLIGGKKAKVLEEKSGVGRYGLLEKAHSLEDYLATFIQPLNLSFRLTEQNLQRKVEKIALVNGSGASYLKLAIQKKADLFITGDVDYHTAMTANEFNMPLLDIGHNFEYLVTTLFKEILSDIISEQNIVCEILTTNSTFDPWNVRYNAHRQ